MPDSLFIVPHEEFWELCTRTYFEGVPHPETIAFFPTMQDAHEYVRLEFPSAYSAPRPMLGS